MSSNISKRTPRDLEGLSEFPNAQATPTGLMLDPSMSYDEWERVGRRLEQVSVAWQWWVGDWLNFGELRKWGERYSGAIGAGFKYQEAQDVAWVARSVQFSVRTEKRSWNHHKLVAKFDPTEQREWLDKAIAGDWSVADLRKELNSRDRNRQLDLERVQQIETPLGAVARHTTIVIDPPWDWGDEGDVDQMGRAKPEYATMPIEEITALPIGDIATTDAHLYLWITNRSLPKGFDLLEAWGFRYVTALVWVKPHFGMGNYFRGQHEHILFGVKGQLPLLRKDVGTVLEAPRGGEHSAKPDEMYDLIATCSPGPYLDVFGRKPREGWTVWPDG